MTLCHSVYHFQKVKKTIKLLPALSFGGGGASPPWTPAPRPPAVILPSLQFGLSYAPVYHA